MLSTEPGEPGRVDARLAAVTGEQLRVSFELLADVGPNVTAPQDSEDLEQCRPRRPGR